MSIWVRLNSSFNNACKGLLLAFRQELSFRIQLAIGLFITSLAFLFPLERWERSVIILAISAVLVLELLNSIIERFVDMVKPRVHEYARDIKDLAAASVLLMACAAVILAAIIFLPYFHLLVNL